MVSNTTTAPGSSNQRISTQVKHMNQLAKSSPKFMVWVDGVGGYLACLANKVCIGQAIPGNDVELPLIADISRQHLTLERVDQGYVARSTAPTWIGNDLLPEQEPRLLSDGDELRLGDSVRLAFRQPHPLSATARLDILSGHRLQPSADGVLLVAQSCIFGAASSSHVVCRQWARDLVLVREDQAFRCHVAAPFEVDDTACEHQATVTLESRILGDDFCLSLERID